MQLTSLRKRTHVVSEFFSSMLTDFGRSQFVASKIILEFLLLGYLLQYLPPPKNKVNAARLNYVRTVCKIGILSENKLSLGYIN